MTWSRFILAVITPVVVLTFCHFGGAASANTIGLKTIKEAYDQSDVVANVVIESSRAHAANGTIELLPVLKTPRLGVFIEPEVGHGKTDVYEGIQG
jgi:hypothetical protein